MVNESDIDALAQKILTWEGPELGVHSDSKGILTYGPGFALIVRGAAERFLPRPKAEIEATVGGAEFIG